MENNERSNDALAMFAMWFGIATAAGAVACIVYDGRSEEGKKQWRKDMPMHHGALGCFVVLGSVLFKSPAAAGAGLGLMLTDLQDIDEWFAGSSKA